MKVAAITLVIACLCFSAAGLYADEVLETYRARLSARDHFNSSGQRLTTPAAIIRQDRANFHRYNAADPEDEGDTFFANAKNRDILEKLLERGRTTGDAYRAVVNGTPLVAVSVVKTEEGVYITVNIISM